MPMLFLPCFKNSQSHLDVLGSDMARIMWSGLPCFVGIAGRLDAPARPRLQHQGDEGAKGPRGRLMCQSSCSPLMKRRFLHRKNLTPGILDEKQLSCLLLLYCASTSSNAHLLLALLQAHIQQVRTRRRTPCTIGPLTRTYQVPPTCRPCQKISMDAGEGLHFIGLQIQADEYVKGGLAHHGPENSQYISSGRRRPGTACLANLAQSGHQYPKRVCALAQTCQQ